MRFPCVISQSGDRWLVRHDSRDVGQIEVRGATRDEALEKIRGEIRYRLELCPCTGETYQHIHIEIVEASP